MGKKVRVKESIAILKEDKEIYKVVFTCARKIKKIKTDGLIRLIIDETKQEKDYYRLVRDLSTGCKRMNYLF